MATNVWIDLPGVLIEPGTIVIGHVIVDNFPAVQPVSGTVTVNQGTSPWVVSFTAPQHVILDSGTLTSITNPVTVNQGTSPWVVSGTITTSPNVNVHDGTGVSISSTGNSLNVDVTNTVPVTLPYDTNYGTVGATTLRTASQIGNATGAANFGAGTTTAQTLRVVLPTDQTPIPVTQSTSPWVISGTVTANQGTSPWVISFTAPQHVILDSGTLTSITNPVTVNQGTSPWVISGTVTANQGGTWNINNITGTISLPTGASTAANQTTANTSLASIDAKLTAPLSVTPTQAPNPFHRVGNVATAATTQARVMETPFTYIGANTTLFVASSSANDTLAGTGAQKISIIYFKADGSGPFTETDNLNGTTGFFTSNSMAFVEKVTVSQVGSGGSNVGTILVSNLAPLSTVADIAPGENETFYAHHFVPLGKTAYVTQFSYGSRATAAGQGGIFVLKKQAIPLASNPIVTVTGDVSLVGTSSTDDIVFPTPIVVTGPAVMFALVTPDSATANTFTAAIGGYEQ